MTSHNPAGIRTDARQELLFPVVGLLGGQGPEHTNTDFPMHSLPLLVIPMDSLPSDRDIPKQWLKQRSKYCRQSPEVRLDYTSPRKSEPDLHILSVAVSSHPEDLNYQRG